MWCFFSSTVLAQTTPLDTLIAPTPCAFCQFGFAVGAATTSGDEIRLIVSEVARPVGPQFPVGVVYSLTYDPLSGALTHEATLMPPGDTAVFGGSVSIAESPTGTFAVVGGGTFGTTVWRRDEAGAWTREAVFEGIDKPGGGGAAFGSDVTAHLLPSGEEVVFVGASNGGDNPTGTTREGSAYALVRAPATPPGPDAWAMEVRLVPPNGVGGDRFGDAVALLPTPGLPGGHPGDALALVGARGRTETGQPLDSGATFVYIRDGATGTWILETVLLGPDPEPDDAFGSGVALLPLPGGAPGEVLALVGAYGDFDLDLRAGAAYAFCREVDAAAPSGFRWTREATLYPALPSRGHFFGGTMALAADTLESGTPIALALIGSSLVVDGFGHPGEASLFARTVDGSGEAVWTRRAVYTSGSGQADRFGTAVDLVRVPGPGGGVLALVGAYASDAAQQQGFPAASDAGAVFVYDGRTSVGAEPEDSEIPTDIHRFTVFPNPASHTLHVRAGSFGLGAEAIIADVLGRVVRRVHLGPFDSAQGAVTVDVSSLAPGVYVVRVEGTEVRMSRTVTVVR